MEERFGRYLLRELLWELDQSGLVVPELEHVSPEKIEVLAYSGYNSVRIRVASAVLDADLSWRKDVPPTVVPVTKAS
jgi:hypothetical protein